MTSVELGKKLQSLKRGYLYLALALAALIPLFFSVTIPNQPADPAIDFYRSIMSIPSGSTVFLSSDWTYGTRGESGGAFEAVVRILMRRNIKFVEYSESDPQAPQVAKNEIAMLNEERVKAGLKPYEEWNDWIDVGFFPNADGTNNAFTAGLKGAFKGKTEVNPQGKLDSVFNSPVLQGKTHLSDIAALIGIESTSATTSMIQRLSGKIKILFCVTGVMGPETEVYYLSKQVSGLASGIKGVYDLETMMEYGVNVPDANGKVMVSAPNIPEKIPNFPGMPNFGRGKLYYPSLHATLILMILAVVIGNAGMFMAKRGKKS